MSKIMPPMSNVKTRAIRNSRKNSFTGRGFYHTRLAVGKSIVLAWEHGGADFQSRFDKSTGQAQEMKEGGAAGAVGSP
jgi:hypothetical protein